MQIFVTGATGYPGGTVVAELLAEGHDVVGLTSSESRVTALEEGTR